MTFLEKLRTEHPEYIGRTPEVCPQTFDYENDWDCTGVMCNQCWNREIPETDDDILKGETKMAETRKTKKELLEEIAELKKDVERLDRYKAYEDGADDIKAMYDIYISKGFTEEQSFKLVEKMIDVAGLMNRG